MSNTAQYIIEISTNGDRATVSRVDAVQRKLDATDRSAARLSGRVGGLGKALQGLPGAGFFANPLVQLTAGIGVVSKLGMQAEKTATAFNVLVGSEDKAAKMLGEINEYADKTLWDRSSTQEAAKTMLGFGVSAESVTKDLKMLGDVAMGDKNKLQQLALVFGQISAAGKLQGQDLLQLINAGYNPLLDISAQTGKSVAKLKDEMSKGLVTFDMVRAAFQRATGEGGKFNQMTEKIAQTTYGAWEQLKGKFLGAMLELYELIRPAIIPVINVLGKGLEAVGAAAKWVAENFSTILSVLAPVAAGVVAYNVAVAASTALTNGWTIATRAQYVALLLLEKAQKLVNIVMSANPIALIIAGIAALATAVAICWNKFAGFRAVILTVWETMKGFGQIIKNYVLDRIQGLLAGVGKLGEAFSKLFKGDFKGAWDAAKGAASGLLGLDARRNAAESTRQLVGGVKGTYGEILSNERAKQSAKEALKSPEAAGGVADTTAPGITGASGAGASGGKMAKDIATGGTRNTSITINVSKFFDDVNITTASGTDLRQLQNTILESINRSLEIATSAAR
jgi:tape measure domain-containing protein